MQQWHFDIQHELLHNTVVTVSYVGSKGTHLGRQTDLNQLHPTPLASNPYKPGEAISTETTTLCPTATSARLIAASRLIPIPVSLRTQQRPAVNRSLDRPPLTWQ